MLSQHRKDVFPALSPLLTCGLDLRYPSLVVSEWYHATPSPIVTCFSSFFFSFSGAAKPDPLRLKRLGQWKNRPTVTLVTDRDLGHTGRDLGHIGGRDIAHTGGRDIAHCGRDLGHAEHMLTPVIQGMRT